MNFDFRLLGTHQDSVADRQPPPRLPPGGIYQASDSSYDSHCEWMAHRWSNLPFSDRKKKQLFAAIWHAQKAYKFARFDLIADNVTNMTKVLEP